MQHHGKNPAYLHFYSSNQIKKQPLHIRISYSESSYIAHGFYSIGIIMFDNAFMTKNVRVFEKVVHIFAAYHPCNLINSLIQMSECAFPS